MEEGLPEVVFFAPTEVLLPAEEVLLFDVVALLLPEVSDRSLPEALLPEVPLLLLPVAFRVAAVREVVLLLLAATVLETGFFSSGALVFLLREAFLPPDAGEVSLDEDRAPVAFLLVSPED